MARDPRIQRALDEYGARLKGRREQSNMTQGDLAGRSGVSQSHISKIERGMHEPTLGQMLKLQAALEAETLEGFLGPTPAARWMRIAQHGHVTSGPKWD